MNLWQLKKISTGEDIGEPKPLPENWGPIFGMHNIKDRLQDLSWLKNPDIEDLGWFDTGMPIPLPPEPEPIPEPAPEPLPEPVPIVEEQLVEPEPPPEPYAPTPLELAQDLLRESDWTMLFDAPLTKGQRAEWEAYRKALREIRLQPGYPDEILWPNKPE